MLLPILEFQCSSGREGSDSFVIGKLMQVIHIHENYHGSMMAMSKELQSVFVCWRDQKIMKNGEGG